MVSTLVWNVALIAALAWITQTFLNPLRRLPGPFLARFTDAWYFWRVSRGKFEVENIKLHKTFGPVVRYGPNRVSISDPEASKTIYGLGTSFAKSDWYQPWAAPGRWTIFSDQDIQHHAQTRRLYQSTFSMISLVSYEPYVDECADIFVERLTELARAGASVDMGRWFQNYAFDVIGMITYAKRLGFLDRGEDIGGIISALGGHLTYATLVGIYPRFHPVLHWLQGRVLGGTKGRGREFIIHFTQQLMATSGKFLPSASADGNDDDSDEPAAPAVESFLSKFQSKHTTAPEIFTPYHVLTGCAANMVAGSDTTAITLSAILYYLLRNPACLDKLKSEIGLFASLNKLSASPTFKESQQMPYLQAVIKEALRIHPATGLPIERVVPPGGSTIAGFHFQAGTIVGINSWVQHRNPQIFGSDADEFRPERWIDEPDTDRLSDMNRHWIPFGLGSRTCIGRHISTLEIGKLVPRILRDFNFTLDGPVAGQTGGWETQNMWFVKPQNFRVTVTTK